MHEKLLFAKCDFCGRGIPWRSRYSVKKTVKDREMKFCEESCYELSLKYEEIKKSNEK